ncbi:hypothetical protein D3C85_1324560 [compost metagenome]
MMWNATATKLRPSAMMLPQLGICGGMPTPRKLSTASVRMADAAMKVACTIRGANRLGRIWRSRMAGTRVPTDTAASI